MESKRRLPINDTEPAKKARTTLMNAQVPASGSTPLELLQEAESRAAKVKENMAQNKLQMTELELRVTKLEKVVAEHGSLIAALQREFGLE